MRGGSVLRGWYLKVVTKSGAEYQEPAAVIAHKRRDRRIHSSYLQARQGAPIHLNPRGSAICTGMSRRSRQKVCVRTRRLLRTRPPVRRRAPFVLKKRKPESQRASVVIHQRPAAHHERPGGRMQVPFPPKHAPNPSYPARGHSKVSPVLTARPSGRLYLFPDCIPNLRRREWRAANL